MVFKIQGWYFSKKLTCGGVLSHGGTTKSSISIGFFIININQFGDPSFMETPISLDQANDLRKLMEFSFSYLFSGNISYWQGKTVNW